MAKVINLNMDEQVWKLGLFVSKYQTGGNLFIGLFDTENQEPFADLTINIQALPEGLSCVNTEDYPWLAQLIKDTGIGIPTGNYLKSAFGAYPVYKFDLNKVKEYQINKEEED